VHDHFEKSDGGDANVFEVVGVFAPETGFVFGFNGDGVVGVEGVAGGVGERDGIGELWNEDKVVSWSLND